MGLKNKTILIVDDDADIRNILVRILEPTGLVILTAEGPGEARQHLRQAPHLILTDLNMEPEDGFAFIQGLKLNPEYARIPILILSSLNDFKTVKKGISLGIQDYILKPIQPMVLLQKLKKVLAKQDILRWELPESEATIYHVPIKAQVSALGETGFTLQAGVKLPPDQEVKVRSPLFEELKLSSLALKTSKTVDPAFLSGAFQNDVGFIGVNETDASSIRKFLSKNRTS